MRHMPTFVGVDRNQPAIVKALTQAGALVQDLHVVGHGCPDLLVYFNGQLYLLEVKVYVKGQGRRKLERSQVAFQERGWPVTVVYDEADALRAIGVVDAI